MLRWINGLSSRGARILVGLLGFIGIGLGYLAGLVVDHPVGGAAVGGGVSLLGGLVAGIAAEVGNRQ